MPESRSFRAPNLNLTSLGEVLDRWFRNQGFETQTINLVGGDVTIQARKGGWRNLVGMSSALNVAMRPRGDSLVVEIGEGKWADKAAVAAVSMFVLWPLAATAAYGAWQQGKLPTRTFEFIQQNLAA